MEHYLINSTACLAILLLFHKLILEKEQMHHFKRGYLIISVIASLSIPLITFTNYVDAATVLFFIENTSSAEVNKEIVASEINWNVILWAVYGIGLLLFSFRFILNLYSIFLRIRKNPKLKNNHYTAVLLKSNITPHTFLRYVFFNKISYEQHLIPSEVFMHEKTHAKELHSLDILIMEFLQILFWFNPLIYLAKSAIKLNHEFIADQAVILRGIETKTYQKTLLAFSSNAETSNLVSAFNYLSIKKRFKVMKTHTSKKIILLKTILVVPLFAVLVYSCSSKKEISKIAVTSISDVMAQPEISVVAQDMATEKMVKEYHYLAKKSNALPKKERILSSVELERMTYIFARMNKKQKESTVQFPEIMIQENAEPITLMVVQDIATEKMVKEYIKLVKNYNALPKKNRNISSIELERMIYIYARMNKKQKESTVQFPEIMIQENATPVPISESVYMQKLSEKGAIFYFEAKQITGKEAVEISKNNNKFKIQVREYDSKKSIVEIFKDPFVPQ